MKKRYAVFSPCDDEVEELEPIVFHVPALYDKKVKIHDWQAYTLAEPRDNTNMFPPKGRLHDSSYQRLGPDDDCHVWMSETQAMLSQIELKDSYKPIYPHRSLLNMHSFAMTEQDEQREEDLKLTDILLDAEEALCMDYRTTTEMDYQAPHPIKPRPLPPPPRHKPWILNRRTIGYSLEGLEKRRGINTFLDDNMEVYEKIAEIKMKWNKKEGSTPKADESNRKADSTVRDETKLKSNDDECECATLCQDKIQNGKV